MINAHAPGPSKSIYISKTNQKLNISYIPTLRHYRNFFFPYKSLVKKKVPTYVVCARKKDFHHYDSHFTSLRGLFDSSKNQRNPMPKHVELQIISTHINQWTTDVGVRTFLRNLKIRQKLKKNNKANVPINKLFEKRIIRGEICSNNSPTSRKNLSLQK